MDENMTKNINELAAEEHALIEREAQGIATQADQERLQQIRVTLDQCWDLLRQRRALREFGRDPNEAKVRDKKTVENYSG